MEISKSEGIKKQQKHSVAKSLMMINKLYTFFAASGFTSSRYQLNVEGTNIAPLKLNSLLLCDFIFSRSSSSPSRLFLLLGEDEKK